jgi:CRP-like cAMP-binding protein
MSAKQRLQETLPLIDRLEGLFGFLAKEETAPAAVEDQPFDMTCLIPYMERMEVKPGQTLIRQGESATGLYYIETGRVTAQLEQIDGQTIRLSTMGEESVVGVMGLYLGTPASASAIVNQPGTVYFLSTRKLTELENSAPHITAALHKYMAQRLSERLVSANDRLQALLK